MKCRMDDQFQTQQNFIKFKPYPTLKAMFRLAFAKLCFAFCFCLYAYATLQNEYVFNGYKTRVAQNIDTFQIFDDGLAFFISKWLPYVLLMMMASSILMVFGSSMILKVICLAGYIGFMTLNQSSVNRFGMEPEMFQETTCVIGGMFILMGMDKKSGNKVLLTDRELDQLVDKKHIS